MLNIFFKTFFFVSLVIVAAITAVTFTESAATDMLATAVFASQAGISTFVVAALPLAASVLCAILALPVAILIYAIRRKQVASPKKSRFFLYYFIALIVVSLLVLHACLLLFIVSERAIREDEAIVLALLYGACIVEALVIAALLVSLFTLWKTNKPVACIIGLVILFCLSATYISGFAIHDVSYYMHDDDDYSYTVDSDSLNLNDDSQTEEVDEGYTDYDEGVDSDYLSFLFDMDDYGVRDAASVLFESDLAYWNSDYQQLLLDDLVGTLELLKTYDIATYTSYMPTEEAEKQTTLNRAYHYLTENPEEADETLISYSDVLLYHYMPKEEFYGTAAHQLISYLSEAHNDLYFDDDLTRLHNIYKLMSNIEHPTAADYYDDIKPHIDDGFLQVFYDKDGELYQGGVVWAYSFWARRNAEGTDDIAYTLLSMLIDYYMDAEVEVYYDSEDVPVDTIAAAAD